MLRNSGQGRRIEVLTYSALGPGVCQGLRTVSRLLIMQLVLWVGGRIGLVRGCGSPVSSGVVSGCRRL
jgi:hypothetical protein